jgi:glycosyltransferase involved in cell wall biosynthesis
VSERRPVVVHVISGDLWAGSEAATLNLLAALHRAEQFALEVLLLNEGELATRSAALGIPTHVVPESAHGFAALRRHVAEIAGHADLVHAHDYKENLLVSGQRRPWISTVHGRPERMRGFAALRMAGYHRLNSWALRRADRVIGVSPEVCEWAVGIVGPARADAVTHIGNGIDDVAAGLEVPRWAKRPMRVGVLARLMPVKAVDLAIDAVAACADVELEIVGDGPERESLTARAAASAGADRIHFAGFDPFPAARLARWRALLVTSHHEGHPMSVMEALAVGTPVVHANLAGVAEMVGDRAGRAVASRVGSDWSVPIEALLRDLSAGEAASVAARERFGGEFSADECAKRMSQVYAAVLESASASK